MPNRSRKTLLRTLLCAAALPGCAPLCNGTVECRVLYATPGPRGGREIYVNVLNNPGLGVRKTLRWEGQEFGTFAHVAIVHDPGNRYAANRTICFTRYRRGAAAPGGALGEEGIPRVVVIN